MQRLKRRSSIASYAPSLAAGGTTRAGAGGAQTATVEAPTLTVALPDPHLFRKSSKEGLLSTPEREEGWVPIERIDERGALEREVEVETALKLDHELTELFLNKLGDTIMHKSIHELLYCSGRWH